MQSDVRIYAQMQPDKTGLECLQAVQSTLLQQPDGRMIGRDELHLTLIHFGKVQDAFTALTKRMAIPQERFNESVTAYIAKTTALLLHKPIALEFDDYALFGPRKTALVARFKPNEELTELHTKLYSVLVDFFTSLGIHEPIEYMKNDPNLHHAAACDPHVTLFKGYTGQIPDSSLRPINFTSMDVVYQETSR